MRAGEKRAARPVEPFSIRGVVYRSDAEAAAALGLATSTIKGARWGGQEALDRVGLGYLGGGRAAETFAAARPGRPRGWTRREIADLREHGTAAELALVLGTLGLADGYPADPAARGMA